MPTYANQRRSTRIDVAFRARVMWETGSFNSPSALNVSTTGILLKTEHRLPVGTECHLILFLMVLGDERKVLATGRVVRQAPSALAFEFTSLRGTDSEQNLRTLIQCAVEPPEPTLRGLCWAWA